MPTSLKLDLFLSRPGTILDVRSPSEFCQGHIPGSYSLPLFTDEERTLVGTMYKQTSREAAIDLGLQLVGPKLYQLVAQAKSYLKKEEGKILCWRGGMRSGFIASLFESIGFPTVTLEGGYKSFRRWVLNHLDGIAKLSPSLYVLGGLTGSGKTEILQALHQLGEQVIDLEALANHRGSAFGMLGLPAQPSQEHFENLLAYLWSRFDLRKPIWIEDESRLIGRCYISTALYHQMAQAPLFYIEVPKECRIHNLLNRYGQASLEDLICATQRISKRLGKQKTQEVIHFLSQNQKKEAFELLLSYYDKTYEYHLNRRHSVRAVSNSAISPMECARHLQQLIYT